MAQVRLSDPEGTLPSQHNLLFYIFFCEVAVSCFTSLKKNPVREPGTNDTILPHILEPVLPNSFSSALSLYPCQGMQKGMPEQNVCFSSLAPDLEFLYMGCM